jgi:hypothetical protein
MMRTTIGGTLDTAALSRLHFNVLDKEAKAAAIRRLAATGQTDATIATATGLSIEMVRRILADRTPSAEAAR